MKIKSTTIDPLISKKPSANFTPCLRRWNAKNQDNTLVVLFTSKDKGVAVAGQSHPINLVTKDWISFDHKDWVPFEGEIRLVLKN